MKWKRLLILALLLCGGLFAPSPVQAANPIVHLTVTAWVAQVMPPTGLTLTDMGVEILESDLANLVTVNWTLGELSTYTMLRISGNEYSTLPTDGFLLYYGDGTSVNITGWDVSLQPMYVTAWGFESDNVSYSSSYAQATIGGEGMEELAEAVTSVGENYSIISNILNTIASDMIYLILVLAIAAIAFLSHNRLVYLVAGFGLIFYGFSYWNTIWQMSMILVIFGLASFAAAFIDKSRKRARE